MKIMTRFQEVCSVILLSLFEGILGVLLLVSPVGFTTGITMAVGILLIVWGLDQAYRYIRTAPEETAGRWYVLKSLTCLLAGIFFVCRPGWMIAAFPLLHMVYGVTVLLVGFIKVQRTADMLRQKKKRWYLTGADALLTVICAALILVNPFGTAGALWLFAGISLIAESVLDIVVLIATVWRGKTE